MATRVATVLLGIALLAAPACGRKGPLVLPPGRAPLPVEGLTAAPGEGTVVLRWMNPVKDVSGRPLPSIGAVEIWVFDRGLPAAAAPLAAETVEKKARLARKITGPELTAGGGEAPGLMTFVYALPPAPAAPSKLAFAVRVLDRRGRASEFSAPVVVDLGGKEAGVDPSPPAGVS